MKRFQSNSSPNQAGRNWRLRVVIFVAGLVILYFLGRLFYLQVFGDGSLQEAAVAQRRTVIELPARRGAIYDRQDRPLAISVTVSSVYVFPNQIPEEKREEAAERFAYVLGLEKSSVEKMLSGDKDYVQLKTKVSQEEIDRLESAGLTAYRVEQEPQRFYPNQRLAAQTLGFVDGEGEGTYGLEAAYDSLLHGIGGQIAYSRDLSGNIIPTESLQTRGAVEGMNLRTTLDLDAQKIVAEEIQKGMEKFQAEAITAILMDPNAGDILAMDNLPTFDPNKPREPLDTATKSAWGAMDEKDQLDYLYSRWKNPAVSTLYEPGSVFKTLTASIALETKSTHPDSRYLCTGKIEIAPGLYIHCWREEDPHGWQTLEEALINSCNPAFVQIVREIGSEAFYSYLRSFHMGEATGIDLPGETASLFPETVQAMSDVQMQTMSYGHGVSVTPLEMITAANTVINGGYYRVPHLFSASFDADGQILHTYEPPSADPILSQETVETMRGYLLNTSIKNHSDVTKIKDVEIGSKSGTTLMLENGAYTNDTIASFYSFYPAKEPRYSMLVVVKRPKGDTFGSVVAGEVSAHILERLVSLQKGEAPNESGVRVPDVSGMTVEEARQALETIGLRASAFGAMTPYSLVGAQKPAAGSLAQSGDEVQLQPDEKRSLRVPNLVGMSVDEAEAKLKDAGLQVHRSEGAGERVISQQPEADAVVSGSAVIELIPGATEGESDD